MKSRAWVIIHASFIVLLIKWIYDGWLLYEVTDFNAVIHEILTLMFAVGISIGFTIFCDDFTAARKWTKKFGINSSDTNKALSKGLVNDLEEEDYKEIK